MTKSIKRWRLDRLLFPAFLAACIVAAIFAIRFLLFAFYWHDPAHRDQPLEGWMTMRYIAHSYHVPPQALAEQLDLEPLPEKRRTISEIAKENGIELDAMKARIDGAIAGIRQGGATR